MLLTFRKPMAGSFRFMVRSAGVGCLLVAAGHISTLLNRPFTEELWQVVIFGLFIIWACAMIAVGRFNRRILQEPRRVWSIVLESAPTWMKAFVVITWLYAVVNWVAVTGQLASITSSDEHFARVGWRRRISAEALRL
jgi:hypothetical protein